MVTKKKAKKAAAPAMASVKRKKGRTRKAPEDKHIKVSVSIPMEMYQLGKRLGSVSHFLQQLYYGAL